MKSIQNGLWSNPATWGGVLPTIKDTPEVAHDIMLDTDISVTGLTISGNLTFKPDKSVTLQSTKNIIVTGKLIRKSDNPKVIHIIRFTGIKETEFVGGGEVVLPSDTGLWVMGDGKLDLSGPERICSTTAWGAIKKGDTIIPVKDTTGWQVGDEIVINPTVLSDNLNYDERIIKAITGNNITIDSPATDHPLAEGQFGAYIFNLTRNMRIEGTPTGRTHIFIKSTQPQSIKQVGIRYVGPRKPYNAQWPAPAKIKGRYGLHFHMCMMGSMGSEVTGCVIRDNGSHSFVSHMSDGVCTDSNIAYNIQGTAFWADLRSKSNMICYCGNAASKFSYIARALEIDLIDEDPTDLSPEFGVDGFLLGDGFGNMCTGNVVIGTVGDPHTYGAYVWLAKPQEGNEGNWFPFRGNIAVCCNNSLMPWQNTSLDHRIEEHLSYSCGIDAHIGAYGNAYKFTGGRFFGTFEIEAGSTDSGMQFKDCKFNKVLMISSPVASTKPTLFLDCTWNSWENQVGAEFKHGADLINCNGPAVLTGAASEIVRIQPASGQPYQLIKGGQKNISPFAPKVWGDGTGLLGTYWNNATFAGAPAFTILDPVIDFTEWRVGIDYRITGKAVSIRWEGFIEFQASETYKLSFNGKIIIDGKQVTSFIPEAGKRYPIKLEYQYTGDRPGASFTWTSPAIQLYTGKAEGEFVPFYQLYPPDTITPPPPPPNKAPVANAGPDSEITLPVNSMVLNGSGTDVDGTISSYAWSQVSGPNTAVISKPSSAVSALSGLIQGTYIMRLTVTDDKGAIGTDDVNVVVKPAVVVNPIPVVSAGPDINFSNSVPLVGSATDDGTIVSYLWSQRSGPNTAVIANSASKSTSVRNLITGAYIFRLTATDDKGGSGYDEVSVVVG